MNIYTLVPSMQMYKQGTFNTYIYTKGTFHAYVHPVLLMQAYTLVSSMHIYAAAPSMQIFTQCIFNAFKHTGTFSANIYTGQLHSIHIFIQNGYTQCIYIHWYFSTDI